MANAWSAARQQQDSRPSPSFTVRMSRFNQGNERWPLKNFSATFQRGKNFLDINDTASLRNIP
jgi:hypothetical protein